MKKFDENGNTISSVQSTRMKCKLRSSKCDRNIKRVFNSTEIEGYRGGEEVESLVSYIENERIVRNKKISKAPKSSTSEEKQKKRHSNKKEKHLATAKSLKKYNSLEELSSNKNYNSDFDLCTHAIQTSDHISYKQSNRLSWGTAELSYLQLNDVVVHPFTKLASPTRHEDLVFGSTESLPSETTGFNIVRSKKSRKKNFVSTINANRSNALDSEPTKFSKNNTPLCQREKLSNFSQSRTKYSETRRKSLSSVGQCDMSDISDVESVYSLPETSCDSNENIVIDCQSLQSFVPCAAIMKNYSGTFETQQLIRLSESKSSEMKPCNQVLISVARQNSIKDTVLPSNFIDNTKSRIPVVRKTENLVMGKTPKSTQIRPAVVMMDDSCTATNELVFGFDIDQKLLYDDLIYEVNCKDFTDLNFDTTGTNHILKSDFLLNNGDLEHIVNFVGCGKF